MRLTHLALAFLVVLVWGFNFVVMQIGLHQIPPLFLCATRFFLTSLPAIFFIPFPATSFKMVAFYGLIMFGLQFALLFMGIEVGIAPGLASLLLQSQAFFTILLAVFFLGETLNRWQVVGAIVSFCGIGLVGLHIGGSMTVAGFLFLMASAASWGTGNVISKKIGNVDMFALVIWGSFIAWPPLLALSLIVDGPAPIVLSLHHLSWQGVGSILYLTYLSTLFGFGSWNFLLKHYPLQIVAPLTLLVPIIAVINSVAVLGETLEMWKIAAGILVIGGLCINLLDSRFFKKGSQK